MHEHVSGAPRAGEIGPIRREIVFEPLTEPVRIPEPVPTEPAEPEVPEAPVRPGEPVRPAEPAPVPS